MFVLHTYVTYLVISIAVTIWVARTLHRSGRIFLVDAFHGQEALATRSTTCWSSAST